MSNPFLGEIRMFAGNFAPRNWAFCNGQLLSIAQNSALFSLLGTVYGGDGMSTFGLPDLRGRSPMHFGQGSGLSNYTLGETSGTETMTLLSTQMPAHTHTLKVSGNVGDSNTPAARYPAASPTRDQPYSTTGNTTMAADTVGSSGGSQPFSVLNPRLTVNFIIALNGIFPSRN